MRNISPSCTKQQSSILRTVRYCAVQLWKPPRGLAGQGLIPPLTTTLVAFCPGYRQVLMELSRRKWPTLELGPLQNWRKRDIVEAFLKRSLTRRRLSAGDRQDARGKRLPGSAATFITGMDTMGGDDEPTAQDTSPGLVLFPSMIEKILSK